MRRFITFALAAAWLVSSAGFAPTSARATVQSDPQKTDKKDEKKDETPQTPVAPPKTSKEPTAEQVAELVIYVYGSRERIEQIQRNSIERGRVTRSLDEGRTEEVTYERRQVRGGTSEKDKIRLDQKTPTMEYSLLYTDGRVWGIINGTPFTPRQETVAPFLANTQRGLNALLRYKEDGSTLAYVGKEKQKNIEMWVLDVFDKEKRRTRFYISTQKWRILWLEYEETPSAGAKPVQFKRTFHDYRYAQGQLVAYRSVFYVDGKQAEETNVLNVTFGTKMDDSIFKTADATAATTSEP
ncbi:MAG TPA: hypothetical protein VNA19_01230 [Pyrinomonadaceae bacterium]|nr:hypothetical protein [Pyrinomonadaceae bacterium]